MIIYRCQACGKWSHAKRKPQFHKRSKLDPADDDRILDEIKGYEPETGAPDSLFIVACGPFETYEAVRLLDLSETSV